MDSFWCVAESPGFILASGFVVFSCVVVYFEFSRLIDGLSRMDTLGLLCVLFFVDAARLCSQFAAVDLIAVDMIAADLITVSLIAAI